MKSINFRIFIMINIFFLIFFSTDSIADEKVPISFSERMQSILKNHSATILKLANSPVIINSVREQNEKDIPLKEIKAIDREWIAGEQNEFAKSLQENAVGKYLREIVEESILYVEAFLCDKKGAIVGLFPITTDYWQGDENKFIESYGNGKGRIIFNPLSFDESTKTYSIQISIPVNDWNNTIGVLIVGIKNIQN